MRLFKRTVVFVPTAKTIDGKPSPWLAQRLDTAYQYYKDNQKDIVGFVISGRWGNSTDINILESESLTSKKYLLEKDPTLDIKIEEFSVETGGNFAFSKQIISELDPERVVIITSKVLENRTRYFAKKIFGNDWNNEFIFVNDSLSENPLAIDKEPKALNMFKSLFTVCVDGDDLSARKILLEKTPFYNKNIIQDKLFFDKYWPGGYVDFLEKRKSIDNK